MLGWNWSICITHLYSIESSQIVVTYHHHELCAPKDEARSTEGAKTGWHHAATSGVSPVCELRPANRCDHKLVLWSIMWEVGWEPSSQSTNLNTMTKTIQIQLHTSTSWCWTCGRCTLRISWAHVFFYWKPYKEWVEISNISVIGFSAHLKRQRAQPILMGYLLVFAQCPSMPFNALSNCLFVWYNIEGHALPNALSNRR